MTIQEFVNAQHMGIKSTRIPFRPDSGADDVWGKKASHWACIISCADRAHGRTVQAIYSMGSAHKGKPGLDDVLDSLRSDAQGAESPFDEWASDLGLDTDSRKALAAYEACVKVRRQLLDFLGRDAFRELIGCDPL